MPAILDWFDGRMGAWQVSSLGLRGDLGLDVRLAWRPWIPYQFACDKAEEHDAIRHEQVFERGQVDEAAGDVEDKPQGQYEDALTCQRPPVHVRATRILVAFPGSSSDTLPDARTGFGCPDWRDAGGSRRGARHLVRAEGRPPFLTWGDAHSGAEPGFCSKDALSASTVMVRSLTANRRQIGVPRRHTPYDTNLPRWRTSVSLSPEGSRW